MPLTVAVQMDPLEDIGIAGDSTFALMLSRRRAATLCTIMGQASLSYREGRVAPRLGRWRFAACWATISRRGAGRARPGRRCRRGADAAGPAVRPRLHHATHLLERIAGDTLVVNDPASVRNAPEKLFVLDFAQFMPPTLITRRLEEVRAFHADHGEVVVKPLYGNAGSAVFHVGARTRTWPR
jgi:glutathione synthase